MSNLHEIAVTVNGTLYRRSVEPRLLLSDFLRHDLELTGTHVGCEHGVCGACTILFDGLPARSCLIFAVQANGHEVQTVESLGTPDPRAFGSDRSTTWPAAAAVLLTLFPEIATFLPRLTR